MRLFEIAESSHVILNPITLEKLILVGEIAGLGPSHRVLDLCCGKAEMLAQWARVFGCSGHGVDHSEVFLAAGAARVAALGVAGQVTLSQGDAEEYVTSERFDVVSCIGASWFGGGLQPSVELMRGWAKPGATLILGECFWAKEPSPEVARALGEDFRSLPDLFTDLATMGFEVVEMVLTDGDGWDRYCAAQWKNLYDWISANPTDPDVDAAKARLKADREKYVKAQRDHLGWGVFVLRPAMA